MFTIIVNCSPNFLTQCSLICGTIFDHLLRSIFQSTLHMSFALKISDQNILNYRFRHFRLHILHSHMGRFHFLKEGYADHSEEYFDHLKDIMLDIQIIHPTLPVIMLGDFNIVLEDRDRINRNANANEVNARRITAKRTKKRFFVYSSKLVEIHNSCLQS